MQEKIMFFEYYPDKKKAVLNMEQFCRTFGMEKSWNGKELFEFLGETAKNDTRDAFLLWLEHLDNRNRDFSSFDYRSETGLSLQITMIPYCEGGKLINYAGYIKT